MNFCLDQGGHFKGSVARHMKTIGLLGGTGWSSTISYYTLLNELVNQRLGGYHSAKILLKSIDYHDIMSNYGKGHETLAQLLKEELSGLIQLKPDCIIICCNSLHKYYDMIANELESDIPVMHDVELVAQHIKLQQFKKVLFLATKFTMEDGFFTSHLEHNSIETIIPNQAERDEMHRIHDELMQNTVSEKSKAYFSNLIIKYKDADAVVLGCTEYPLVVNTNNSALPIINPVYLQAVSAVDYACEK